MGRVLWDWQAKEDLRQIALFIGVERNSPKAARRLVDSVLAECDLYAAQPELGEARPDLGTGVRVFRPLFSVGPPLLLFAWRMTRPVDLFGPFTGLPLVGLGSFAVQGSIRGSVP
jgi:plasmid stabilization system protein ParE